MRSPLLPLAIGVVMLSAAGLPSGRLPAEEPAAAAPAQPSAAPAVTAPVSAMAEATSPAPAEAATAADSRNALAEAALDALASHVDKKSDPDALRDAFEAYFNFKAAHPEQVHNPYLYFVDYGLDSRTPRGYVFDMEALKVVDGPFTVAHGRGSSTSHYGVPTKFSNRSGSAMSSLGLYVTQETYSFSGHSGGRLYHSIGLRLRGVSGRFNSSARARGVVAHGAPYVTPSAAGRSEGCPAMEQSRARRLIPMIANGGLVFLFSPRDSAWLSEGPWMHAGGPQMAARD